MGDFRGHVIPGTFFLIIGVAYLLLAAHRTKRGTSLASFSVPERNPFVLKIIGIVILTCTVIGFLVELSGGVIYFHDPVSCAG